MKSEKILCIIPARGGSKGLKKKNVKCLNGKPLIAWTIDEAIKSKYIEKVVVSTEDNEIEEISRAHAAEVVKRPMELATDESNVIDSVFYTVEKLQKDNYTPEHIILLQCTSPLRNVAHIDGAIEVYLQNRNKCSSLISVTIEEHPPWWLKSIGEDGLIKDFIEYDKTKWTRRQSFPAVYRMNGAIYISKLKELYESKTFETGSTAAYVMDKRYSVDIDTEEDFLFAEHMMKRL